MSVLWNLSNCSFKKLSTDDLFKLQSFISINAKWRGSNYKVAYVVSRDLEYGVSMMMTSIFKGKPPKLRKTFRSISEAMEWVKTPLEEGWENVE